MKKPFRPGSTMLFQVKQISSMKYQVKPVNIMTYVKENSEYHDVPMKRSGYNIVCI